MHRWSYTDTSPLPPLCFLACQAWLLGMSCRMVGLVGSTLGAGEALTTTAWEEVFTSPCFSPFSEQCSSQIFSELPKLAKQNQNLFKKRQSDYSQNMTFISDSRAETKFISATHPPTVFCTCQKVGMF